MLLVISLLDTVFELPASPEVAILWVSTKNRFLELTKRIAASEDENVLFFKKKAIAHPQYRHI